MRTRQFHARARGFTLVELMIVLVIGLVLSLVLMNIMTFYEGSKRTATSVDDVDNAGTAAFQLLDFALRGAGAGFTQTVAQSYGCALNADRNAVQALPLTAAALPAQFANVLGATGINGPIRLAPVVILKNNTPANQLATANGSSDVLLVMAGAASGANAGAAGPGNGGSAGVPSVMTAAPAVGSLTLQNTAAFAANDVVLITDDATPGGRSSCVLAEVAKAGFAPPAAALPLAGSFFSPRIANLVAAMTIDALPVPVGNMAATDGLVARASDNPPQFQLIGVGNSNAPTLYSYDLLAPVAAGNAVPLPLVDSVLELHALYGLDTNGDNVIDTWQDPGVAPFTAAALLDGSAAAASNLQQIKAIRLAMVLRSPLVEKNPVATSYTYFTNVPCAPGAAACPASGTPSQFKPNAPLGVLLPSANPPGEQYYRYRTVETTIPIRNGMLICGSNC